MLLSGQHGLLCLMPGPLGRPSEGCQLLGLTVVFSNSLAAVKRYIQCSPHTRREV